MLTTNNGAGLVSGANMDSAMKRETKKYKVVPGTSFRIAGKRAKPGSTVELYPDDTDTKYLLGMKYIEPVEKEKPKVELDPGNDKKSLAAKAKDKLKGSKK